MSYWNKVKNQLHTIASFKGGDVKYSARAAFHFPDFTSGEVLDIVPTARCGYHPSALVVLFYVITIASFVVTLFPARTVFLRVCCVVVGSLSVFFLLVLLLSSNKKLLYRILMRSVTPYVKLYLTAVEAYCLCSLLGWEWRCVASIPTIILSQFSVFVADAVFYKNTRYTVALLVLFILYRIGIIACVRYSIFGELHYSVFTFAGFRFYNSGNLVSKSLSLLLFQVGQLIFYLRYKHRLFSVRTTYTILSNREWNALERKQRLSIQEEKEIEVMKTISMLESRSYTSSSEDDLYNVGVHV